ncbi:MAG: DUF4493 domain-containing protein [Rikenellaceae bacterium]
MKKNLYIMLAAALLASCSSEDLIGESVENRDEMGCVALSLTSESVIESVTTTRATETYELAEDLLPEQFKVEIKNSEGAVAGSYESLNDYNNAELDPEDLSKTTPPYLKAGDYTVTISDLRDTSVESATNACFAAEGEFTIVAQKTSGTCALTATLQNAAIRVQTTDRFNEYFEGGSKLTLTTTAGSELTVEFPLATGAEEPILFVDPESEIFFSGEATKQDPGTGTAPVVTFTKNSVGTVNKGQMNSVVIDASETGSASVTIVINSEITETYTFDIDLNEGDE